MASKPAGEGLLALAPAMAPRTAVEGLLALALDTASKPAGALALAPKLAVEGLLALFLATAPGTADVEFHLRRRACFLALALAPA